MKKSIIAFAAALMIAGASFAQEAPKPQKDTVNMDTNAKPEFYYAVEDEESGKASGEGSLSMILIIAGAGVVIGAAAFFLLKKKK
jgi:LPXTG-motif cell wall-anchored protein